MTYFLLNVVSVANILNIFIDFVVDLISIPYSLKFLLSMIIAVFYPSEIKHHM